VFSGPRWKRGSEKDLPEHLRTKDNPKATTSSLGTYRAPKSDSESESEDQLKYAESSDLLQLEPSSNAGVPLDLSPINLTSQIQNSETTLIEADPFLEGTSTAIVITKPPAPPREPPPPPPPAPPVVSMTDSPKGAKFDIKKFTGKKDEAEEFVTNLELYFKLNPTRFTENETRIAYALGNIIGGARQWKINKVQDLNDTTKPTIKWDDWNDFKKSFTMNWSEVDSPGSAMNSIYALTEKAKRNKISMESYINLFKEYVQKAGIVTDEAEPNNAAVSLFCQGLPFKVLDKAMNQNPTSLTGWYDTVQRVVNAHDRTSILANVH
jgi:hypothetical protein